MKPWIPFGGAFFAGIVLLTGSGCTTLGPRFDAYGTNVVGVTTAQTDGVVVTNRLDSTLLKPSEEPFRLGPGDQIDIEILGDDSGSVSTFVGPDGKIYFQLLKGLRVWGMTLAETKSLLERELSGFVREPQVALTLRAVESRRVWVMGRVNTPGIYPMAGTMTVLEAITKAGGLFTSRMSGTTEELADLHHSFVLRHGEFLPVNFNRLIREGDTANNVYLEADDFVYIPSSMSGQVFVIGAVFQPRAVAYKDQLSLVSAIANARGPGEGARLHEVAIVRGSLTQPSIALVDYQAIIQGRRPDVTLQPRDIVYVPFSPYRTLERYAQLIVNTFARTVAANEGGHATDSSFQKPGISIPIGP